MRCAADDLRCVIFLYPSKEDAVESRASGASGFVVSIPSATSPSTQYLYAVTNRHVTENGCTVIRFNTTDGRTAILDLKPTDWTSSTDDDLAAVEITGLDVLPQETANVVTFAHTSVDHFLSHEDIVKYRMGEGMEVYVVGRLVAHKTERNVPVARFGAVSLLQEVSIRQENGHLQRSLLVEMHSISGYSGSPVFLCLSAQTPGTVITKGYDYKIWFLGVDWGHLPHWECVRDRSGNILEEHWKVPINSGITGVVPAWRLKEFLYSEEFAADREARDKNRIA